MKIGNGEKFHGTIAATTPKRLPASVKSKPAGSDGEIVWPVNLPIAACVILEDPCAQRHFHPPRLRSACRMPAHVEFGRVPPALASRIVRGDGEKDVSPPLAGGHGRARSSRTRGPRASDGGFDIGCPWRLGLASTFSSVAGLMMSVAASPLLEINFPLMKGEDGMDVTHIALL